METFRSRGVRSIVELHQRELVAFVATWKRFVASAKPMPEAYGDASYESPERLVAHVQGAARSYLGPHVESWAPAMGAMIVISMLAATPSTGLRP